MTDILLSGLSDLDVQRQALAMKGLGAWSFNETVEEVLQLEVVRNSAGVAARGVAQGVVVFPQALTVAANSNSGARPNQQQLPRPMFQRPHNMSPQMPAMSVNASNASVGRPSMSLYSTNAQRPQTPLPTNNARLFSWWC